MFRPLSTIASICILCAPQLAAAQPTFVYVNPHKSNVTYREKIPYKPPVPSDAERLKAVEDRLIKEHMPPEPKPVTAEEIEKMIDKKNAELVEKITGKKPAPAPTAATDKPAEENSAFGKVGGLGPVGGIGGVAGGK